MGEGSHRVCQICGVKERHLRKRRGETLSFAKFPSDEERCKEWVKATGNEDLVHVPIEKLNQLKFICAKHFHPKFYNKNRTHLKKTAIPTLELTKPPLDDSLFAEFPLHMFKSEHAKGNRKKEKRIAFPPNLKEHDYCCLYEPPLHPTLSELDPLPIKEEESISPEPMVCDMDDPLGSPRNDSPTMFDDDGNGNDFNDPEPEPLKQFARQSIPAISLPTPPPPQVLPKPFVEQSVPAKSQPPPPQIPKPVPMKPFARQSIPVPANSPPTPPLQPVPLKPLPRQSVPANSQPLPLQEVLLEPFVERSVPAKSQPPLPQIPKPSLTTANTKKLDNKFGISKREKQLLTKFQALKKEVLQLRKRVRKIDGITSPVLKAMMEAAIQHQKKKSHGYRWTSLHKDVAVNIYKKSPQIYGYFRQLVPMPSVKTVQSLMAESLLKPETDAPAEGEEKLVANLSFRDIVVNEFNENTEEAVRTISLTTPQLMEDNTEKLLKHIRHLNTVVNKLQIQNKLLKERLGSYGKRSENILGKITENMTPAAKVFTRMQYVQTPKSPGARKYSAEEKVLSVSMYNSSPMGYTALCNFFTLPSEDLIEKFSRQVVEGMRRSLEMNGGEFMEPTVNTNVVGSDDNVKQPPVKRSRGGGGGRGRRGGGGDASRGRSGGSGSASRGRSGGSGSASRGRSGGSGSASQGRSGGATRGRGGGKLKTLMRKIELHDLLPPPPRLTTVPQNAYHSEIVDNYNENIIYNVPQVHSTVDVRSHNSCYQSDLDMALAGLTTHMPELD